MLTAMPAVERALIEACREQLDHYRTALALADSLLDQLGSGGDGSAVAQQLSDALLPIATIEARIAAQKECWRQASHTTGPELRALLSQAAETIAAVLERVGRVQDLAQRRQSVLLPRLAALAQGRQMQRAYGQQRRL